MRASDVMSRFVITVTPVTAVEEIARLLIHHGISAVPVVEGDGRLVGIVSEADLMIRAEAGPDRRRPARWVDLFADPDRRADAFAKAHGRTAAEVMSTDLEFVGEDTPVETIARLMEERGVKRLPVLADGRVVGIVTRSDLVRMMARGGTARGETTPLDDLAIKDRFERTLREAGFASARAVTMVVDGGRVRLWGVAQTAKERRAIEIAAAEIPGVVEVENHLAIREDFAAGI